jgi:hypothetical protein
MSALATAVDNYLRTMAQAQDANDIAAATPPLLPHVQAASPEELTKQLRRLYVEVSRGASLPMISTTSLVCGGMVEHGGDPEVCGPFLLDCLGKLLGELKVFWEQVRAHSGIPVTQESAMWLGEQFFNTVAQTHLNPAWAFYFHMPLAMGAIAHLSKSKSLRATARSRPELLAEAHNLDVVSREDPTYLTCMFRVLDDEPLVVLHPAERKGFAVRLTAVADVLQLDTLMAATLIGDPAAGWLPGTRPSPEIVSAVTDGQVRFDLSVDGVFNLWRWSALRSDGTLPVGLTPSELLLPWNAFPADIPLFEGTRVLLIGPRFPPQNWPGTRRYRDMPGALAVERVLPPDEVADWLMKIAAAPRLMPVG